MLRYVGNFFKPVQYGQPYITSDIPVQRHDEDIIENQFSYSPSHGNIGIQDGSTYQQNHQQ